VPRLGYRFIAAVDGPVRQPNSTGKPGPDLTRLAGPGSNRPSIAVLPFSNLSGNRENDYLADLFSEEITNVLSRVPQLKVIARTSTSMFRGEDVRHIARMLNVRCVLEGSLQRADTRIRVTARLIDGETGSHLWSERYERELADLFETEDDIIAAMISALKVHLSPGESIKRRSPPPLAAARAFLKGRYFIQRASPDDYSAAMRLFEQAIELDPSYAEPLFEQGAFYLFHCLSGGGPSNELIPLLRVQGAKILTIDPSFVSAHALRGCAAAILDYNWNEAEGQFTKALASDFVPGIVRFWYVLLILNPLGRFEEGIAHMEAAVDVDPLNAFLRVHLAAIYYWAGQYEQSLRYIIEAMELSDNLWISHFGMGCVQFKMGRLAPAVSAFERAHDLPPWSAQILGHLAGLYRLVGSAELSNETMLKLRRLPGYTIPIGMAIFHSICSEAACAAEWFAQAIDLRDPFALVFIFNPATEAMRQSSLWPSLVQRMNLANARGYK